MTRDELSELHYITPIGNVPSILKLGILCNRKAAKVPHGSVAMAAIQERRQKVVVPGGKRLHDYVNLYFTARNPMLYKRRGQHKSLCVLRLSPDVLDLPGVVVTDANAACEDQYRRFAAAPKGIRIVDRELTYAEWWTDPDPISQYRKKAAKCAEVLVPDLVEQTFLLGAYVSCSDARTQFRALGVSLPASVNAHLFFL